MARPMLAPPSHTRAKLERHPTFSVIVPAYQAADTVGEAVASALQQTVPPLEVIVCDDGSTDELEDALTPYRERIVLLRKQHGGAASARNHALRAAAGEFVVTLDSDDLLLPECLEALGELGATRPDLDLLSTDALFDAEGEIVGRFYDQNRFAIEDQREAILRGCFVGWPAARRERLLAAGGFDESLSVAHDWDAWLRLILDGARAGLVPDALFRYRLRPGSLTSARARSLRERVAVLDKAARNPSLRREERRALASARRAADGRALAAETREALLERRADARGRGLTLAVAPGSRHRARGIGVAAALSPGLARHLLERRPATPAPLDDRLPPVARPTVRRGLPAALTRKTVRHDYLGRPIPRREAVARRIRRIRRPRWLALSRTTPLSERWGSDRGTPVDRFYIERFLETNRHFIRGSVLEIKQPVYTERFGVDVRERQVLDVDPANPHATIVADLARADTIPAESFDCLILTQTLQFIYDLRAAVFHCHRVLRPGGVLLCTVPSVSRVEPGSLEGEHWRFTVASCRRLFGDEFGRDNVSVRPHGNVLSSIAFLAGIAAEELRPSKLARLDEHFPLVVSVRAQKRSPAG